MDPSSKNPQANGPVSGGEQADDNRRSCGAKRPALQTSPDRYALFLDVDGTLLTIAPHPDAVRVPPDLLDLLGRLNQRIGGALALISGRAIANLDALFAPLHLACAGVHGLERRSADATIHRGNTAALLTPLRPALNDFVQAREGLLLEDKEQSLAVHFRNAPAREEEVESFVQALIAPSAAALELKRGKMVLEVKPSGANKGTAITAFMNEPPFAGRLPVFIGDDVTDEDGFRIVNQLDGLSVRVGRSVDTAAPYELADEAAVEDWLRTWLDDDQWTQGQRGKNP